MSGKGALSEFGRLADGRVCRMATLAWPGGLIAEVLEFGAVLRSLRLPTPAGRVECTTGYATLAEYEAQTSYHGEVVGRVANRIADARFEVDGEAFQVTANEGPTCLHGGRLGLSKRLWRFTSVEERAVTLAYDSPDGEEGFPGALACRVRIELVAADTLEIIWEAAADRPTPVNLTHHLYFNLAGGGGTTIRDHELTIAAETYTPVDEKLIPTGAFEPVEGTPFDFRRPRCVSERLDDPHPQLKLGGGYDHNFVLTGTDPAVRLRSPETGVTLEVSTNQPGMQLYGGQGLKAPFGPYGALALEPQNYPNAVNQPGFPDPVLRPGQTYRRSARYRLTAGAPG